MTPEQKAAFIVAQAALFNARVAGMQAENQHRLSCGEPVAYADDEFQRVIAEGEGVLGHNAVCIFFQE